MNKFITKAQDLGRRAAQLRQAVQGLPAQAAQIREAVTMTGGELKQLRADVQSNLQGLRADSEDRLLRSMREINDNAAVFEEAGYDLSGLDLDLALNQRLAVHLDKFEDVPQAALRALLSKQSFESVRSIVAGILKAEETAANVELSHLRYSGLIIHVGAVPMIRMCWRDEAPAAETAEPASAAEQPRAAATVSAPASMFDLRPTPGGAVPIEPKAAGDPEAPAPPPLISPPPLERPAASSWSHDALDRFKKMPGVSKYGR